MILTKAPTEYQKFVVTFSVLGLNKPTFEKTIWAETYEEAQTWANEYALQDAYITNVVSVEGAF